MRQRLKKTLPRLLLLFTVSGCSQLRTIFTAVRPVERLVPQVISVRPHDPSAFTEGLIYEGGKLYESTGRNGQSTLREVDPESGAVLRNTDLSPDVFGEGLAMVGDDLIQLTWKSGVGYRYSLDTFEQISTFPYEAEGWGICYDGSHLYTSDGSPFITQRDTETLTAIQQIEVIYNDQPIPQINELECVGDSIYANVWHTDFILRIDKASGRVTAIINASGLITPEQRASMEGEAVLNGIAYVPESDSFLVTGKLWSWMFEVKFVPGTPAAAAP